MQTVTPTCARPETEATLRALPAVSLDERPDLARNIGSYLADVRERQGALDAKLVEQRVRIRELEQQVLSLSRGAPQRCGSCGASLRDLIGAGL